MEGKQPLDSTLDQQERFHHLFTEHYRRIYSIVFNILHRREVAEDITQEAFVKAFQNIHQLKDPNKFGAWLAVIASNLARNNWKREKRMFLSADIEYPDPVGDCRGDPEQEVMRNLEIERVREALRSLPPEQYQVIVLQYYYDLKIMEIAELLQVRAGTVKSRLSRARCRLSRYLELKPGIGSLPYQEGEPKDAPKF